MTPFTQGWRYDDAADLGEVLASVVETLETQVSQAFQCGPDRGAEPACRQKAADSTARLIEAIPSLRDLLVEDIRAAYDGDPAATSYREVVLAYPCLLAISVYRCGWQPVDPPMWWTRCRTPTLVPAPKSSTDARGLM